MTTITLIIVVVSYLLGSIPFGYLLVRIFRGQDVRKTGSGNIGATNVARTGSKGLAIATLLLDALKGYVAVLLAIWITRSRDLPTCRHVRSPRFATGQQYLFAALAGFCALLGHMFTRLASIQGWQGSRHRLGSIPGYRP